MKDAGLEGLRTARLQLTRYRPEDLDELARLNADPRVMQHLGGTITRAESEAVLKGRILSYYLEHPGLGVWRTLERDSGDCIGFHLLNHIRGTDLVQVGYRLFPDHWGKGYATEMSIGLLRYGFQQLGLHSLCGITALANTDSQKVLLKSGLQARGERVFEDAAYRDYGPLKFFESGRQDWLSWQASTAGS